MATNTEILEAAPGLAVVQHSGSGKANQYYLRGYNLDHGTDLAIFWDDIPINLPTNAHGQGYADLNFLIPETISGLEVRKGPYFADIGDFANAGDLHLFLRDSVPQNIVSATVGSFGYDRFLTLGSTALGGGSLLYAGEFKTYDGPWVTGEDVRRFSGLLRYSQGTATNGFSATAMGYTNNWNSSDQVALRAITTGQIGLFGEIDPSDGGDTSRFMLSTRFAQSDDAGLWKANAYLVKETMNLWNNFTWFTTDPMNGDQFHQHDDRIYGGAGVSRTINGTLFSRPTETLFGVQTRYDDIDVSLGNTARSSVSVKHARRPRRRGQRRHLCAEYDALDRLVQDHRRLARRLFLGVGEFDLAAGELRQCAGRDRQPEIHHDVRSLLQDRIVHRRRHGLSQQRCARRDLDASRRRSDDTSGYYAVSGSLPRRRDRRPHQGDTESGQLHQPFLPAPKLGAGFRGGYRYHRCRGRQVSAPASSSPTTTGSPHG